MGTGQYNVDYSKLNSNYTITMDYGTTITYAVSNNIIVFLISNGNTEPTTERITYVVDTSNYVYKSATIDFKTKEDISITTTNAQNITIKDEATISITNNELFELIFKPVENATLTDNYGNEITSPSYLRMKLESGTTITTTFNESNPKLLTYMVNGKTITYTADTYYAITSYTSLTKMPSADTEIKPTIDFYACVITITKTDVDNVVTIEVDGIEKTEYTLTVEYGTRIVFEAKAIKDGEKYTGLFEYVYTITYNNEEIVKIVYETTNEEYAMSSEISEDKRVWHTGLNSNNEENVEVTRVIDGIAKTISPTFEKKFYEGNLA